MLVQGILMDSAQFVLRFVDELRVEWGGGWVEMFLRRRMSLMDEFLDPLMKNPVG
jgi:hypothetical protein